jgi:hypothetical protein
VRSLFVVGGGDSGASASVPVCSVNCVCVRGLFYAVWTQGSREEIIVNIVTARRTTSEKKKKKNRILRDSLSTSLKRFKEFRPPIFLRKTQEQISSIAEPKTTLHVKTFVAVDLCVF